VKAKTSKKPLKMKGKASNLGKFSDCDLKRDRDDDEEGIDAEVNLESECFGDTSPSTERKV
jgi:hypothetical protein